MKELFNSVFLNTNYSINRITTYFIFFSPFVLLALVVSLLLIPQTRSFGFWVLDENNPIEILTFVFSFCGGVYGLFFAIKNSKLLGTSFTFFYVLFSLFLILVAMEEIAWGQWFFHFETPADWKKLNVQGETTLHNLPQFQGQNDILRMIFGIGGVIGMIIGRINFFKNIGVPLVLISWFGIIILYTALDIITDYMTIDSGILHAIYAITEFIELLIVGSAFIYLLLNNRMLKKNNP
jgi:hypothetical protein